jgi:hypothetical protein
LWKVLEAMERMDERAQRRRGQWKKAAWWMFGGSVANVFVSIALSAAEVTEDAIWGSAVLLAGSAWAWAMSYWARRRDMPDEIRKVLQPVVKAFADDVAPGGKVKVRADMTGLTKEKAGAGEYERRARGTEMTAYEDRVLWVEMPLADGTRVMLELSNSYLKNRRKRRSRSGRTKIKMKWKKLTAATARLIPPADLKWEPGKVDKRWEKLRVSERGGVREARLTRYWKWKSLGEEPKETAPGEEVVGLFLRLAAMRTGGAR